MFNRNQTSSFEFWPSSGLAMRGMEHSHDGQCRRAPAPGDRVIMRVKAGILQCRCCQQGLVFCVFASHHVYKCQSASLAFSAKKTRKAITLEIKLKVTVQDEAASHNHLNYMKYSNCIIK